MNMNKMNIFMEHWCNSESWLLRSLCIFIPSLPCSNFPGLQPRVTVNGLKTALGECGFYKNEEPFQILWMNKKFAFPSKYYELTVLIFSTYRVNISLKISYLWFAGKYCHFTVAVMCAVPIHSSMDPISRHRQFCTSCAWTALENPMA